jgi:catechol 2,3-dioxygenase-like lactoylglutathione lyase family enzyme
MFTRIGRMILLVKDYDEALKFYVDKLGFEKIYDETVGNDGLRYVHIGLPGQQEVALWMLKAAAGEKSLVGRQAGNEPLFVLYTDDCKKTYAALHQRGVEFLYEPEDSEGDIHVHFKDLYGNQVVMVQLK